MVGGSILTAPLAAEAQPAGKVARIGYLSLESSPALYLEAFHEGLGRLGYVDSSSVVIESRLAEGRPEKLDALASELVALKLDAIVGRMVALPVRSPAQRRPSQSSWQ
jgi:hypothetical protein